MPALLERDFRKGGLSLKECQDNSSCRLKNCTVLGDSWGGGDVLNGAKFCTKFKSGVTTLK